MTKEQLTKKLEELMFNQNIDNPYINISVTAQWILDNFTIKAKSNIDWIDDWCELFPKDAKSGGQPIYSKPKDCLNKMQKFLKDNPEYNKELIFASTLDYLRDRYDDNWHYTRPATSFIHHRDKGSLLASWCEKLLNEKSKKPIVSQPTTFFI